MNFPVTISLFQHPILVHAFTEFLGMFIGFRYFLFLRKKQGDSILSENRIYILIGAIFGAVIGSRAVGCLEDVHQFKIAQNTLVFILSNKSIAGGLLGGLWGVEIIKLFINEKQSSGDLFVFPLILAMIIGRIGCFCMGVFENTYGNPTSFFLGMNLGDGVIRHPVMLYEIIFLILLWIFLIIFQRKSNLKNGDLFKYFLISYLLFRFFIEMLKPNIKYILGLGTIQIACILGLFYYLIVLLISKKNYAH